MFVSLQKVNMKMTFSKYTYLNQFQDICLNKSCTVNKINYPFLFLYNSEAITSLRNSVQDALTNDHSVADTIIFSLHIITSSKCFLAKH